MSTGFSETEKNWEKAQKVFRRFDKSIKSFAHKCGYVVLSNYHGQPSRFLEKADGIDPWNFPPGVELEVRKCLEISITGVTEEDERADALNSIRLKGVLRRSIQLSINPDFHSFRIWIVAWQHRHYQCFWKYECIEPRITAITSTCCLMKLLKRAHKTLSGWSIDDLEPKK